MGHCRARTLLEYTIETSHSGVVCKKAVILQVIEALAFFMLSVKGMIFVSLLKTFSVLIFAAALLVCVQLNAGESSICACPASVGVLAGRCSTYISTGLLVVITGLQLWAPCALCAWV